MATSPPGAALRLDTYASEWLASRPGLSARTVELYAWLLDKHVVPALGALSLEELSPRAIRRWHAAIAARRPTTAAKAYRLLASILRTAVEDELIERSPCILHGAGAERAPERPLATIDDVHALAAAMPDGLAPIVELATWCQLRRAELLGLRRRDVDLEAATLSVRTTRTRRMDGAVVEKAPKSTAGRRTIALAPHLLVSLTVHLERFVAAEPDARIFDVTDRALDIAWHRARDAANRPDLRLHDLRHTGLTFAAATGATTAELMHRGGHSSAGAALRYQHATVERDRAIADALALLATSGAPGHASAAGTPPTESRPTESRRGGGRVTIE